MNSYYSPTLSPDDAQQQQMAAQQRAQQQQRLTAIGNMAMINTATTQGAVLGSPLSATSDIPMSGDSLDDIVSQNSHELNRRRSLPQHYTGHGPLAENGADRPLSMLGFGHAGNDYQGYQFADIGNHGAVMGGSYGGMGDMGMPGQSGPFGQPSIMAMSDQPDFNLSPDILGNMVGFSSLNVGSMGADPSALHLFNSPDMGNQYPPTTLGPVSNGFTMDMNISNGPLGATSANATDGLVSRVDDDMTGVDGTYGQEEVQIPEAQVGITGDHSLSRYNPIIRQSIAQDGAEFRSPTSATPRTAHIATPGSSSMPVSSPMTPATTAASEQLPEKKSIYSKSGFDMLRALWYVASRQNKKLNIGAVDMSCAFVVCDVLINDCPIIYVSDNFQNLTGYNKHEIVGKNCRFLQAPTGIVEAGSRREFVENHAVYNLKESIRRGEEIQQSLINYRKGGKPFLNLLTMIPIPWDTEEIRYFIGFQIDLVECPDAISGNEASGAMQVNYKHSDLGQHIWDPPNQSQWVPESGQTLGIDDVSTLLQSYNPKGVTSDWHKQSWDKMLLENADDVIHVVSLKGVFLYVSPSCKKILEYDAAELNGTPIAEICHPSDIVSVTRELKESGPGAPVNLVFRIRGKHSGYMWFESYGNQFSDGGKGRKCIILVGRKRPVYVLGRKELEANGGIGDSEIWTKVSTSGLFLFVSTNIRSLLDLQPADLEGTSMQDLMRKETRPEFGRTIEKARRGKIVSCKHEIHNKRGQVLQACTTFYPGDVAEGQKPSFLLAQTKLVKASSRALAPAAGNTRAGAAAGNSQDDFASMPLGSRSGSSGKAGDSGNSDSSPEATAAGDLAFLRTQDATPAADDNIFEELETTRCTSWQYELRQMEKNNRLLAEELAQLLSSRKKRKRRKGLNTVRDCANCHTRSTPEWRRGPSGQRDLCNSCGLRWAKQTGRVSPRTSSRGNGDSQSKKSNSPIHTSPLHREVASDMPSLESNSKAVTTPLSTTATEDQCTTPTQASTTPIAMSTVTKTGTGNGGAHFNPPQSRPLLEGGSGLGGGGMEMTAIQEERETNA